MIGVRHEEYGNLEYPFSLGIDIERTPFKCSKEKNWHENPEIQLCTAGRGTVLLDGERYDIGKGDIVVVNSNVVHYTFTDDYLRYTCLIPDVDWCRRMNIGYDKLNFSPHIKSPELTELIEKLVSIYSDIDDALSIAKLNEVLLRLMIELAENYASPEPAKPQGSKRFEAIKETVVFIQKNFSRRLTLEEISQAVFMDKFLLCKEFKKYTGQTVVEYLHQYRIVRAIDYLAEGLTVAETAALCGFDNLSFFTKIFKRYTGRTPSSYKK